MAISFNNALLGRNEAAKQTINNLMNDPRYLQQQRQQSMAALAKQQEQMASDQQILDNLGKWGGGLIDQFRKQSDYYDDLYRAHMGDDTGKPFNMNNVLSSGADRAGNPLGGAGYLNYYDVVNAYKEAGKWNPLPSYQMMRDFNNKYQLGLTTEQIAQGVDKFGRAHKDKFGVKFTPGSNDLAVAMSSLYAGIGENEGGGPENFRRMWAENSPNLAQWDSDALARQQQIADAYNNDMAGRKTQILKHVEELDRINDKEFKKADKAFLKAMGSFALSAGLGGIFTPSLVSSFTPSLGSLGANIAAGGITGGLSSAIQGGNIGKGILSGGLTGGLKDLNLGGELSKYLNTKDLGLSSDALKAIALGANTGLGTTGRSLIYGGSLGDSLKAGLLGGAASGAGSYVGSTVAGLAKDAELGGLLSKGLGTLAGGTTAGLIKGQDLSSALTGGLIGAGSGMVGGLVGDGMGKDAGNIASGITSAVLKNLLQQRPNPTLSRGVSSGVTQGKATASKNQMMAIWNSLPAAQKQALLAKYKGK